MVEPAGEPAGVDPAGAERTARTSISERLWNGDFLGAAERADNLTLTTETVLEQYELYLSSAHHISDLRQRCNAFFLTLHTAVLGGVAYLWVQQRPPTAVADSPQVLAWAALLVGLVGVSVSVCWKLLLRTYRSINSVKYRILDVLEDRLPARVYGKAEWTQLNEREPDRPRYIALSKIEECLPVLLGLVYVVVIVVSAVALFGVGAEADAETGPVTGSLSGAVTAPAVAENELPTAPADGTGAGPADGGR